MILDEFGREIEVKSGKPRGVPWAIIIILFSFAVIAVCEGLWIKDHRAKSFNGITFQQSSSQPSVESVALDTAQSMNLLVVSPPADAPPHSIRVGPFVYHVRYTDNLSLLQYHYLAMELVTGDGKREIWLNPKREHNEIRADLVHELFHAARQVGAGSNNLYVNNTTETNEQFIEGASPIMLEVIRDNPKLMQWLQR